MDSFKFHDVRSEKANAISKYRKIQRIATLFRFVEILVFAIIVSRCFAQFAFSFKVSADHLRGVSSVLISPKFVFVIGNAIVVALLLLSGQVSSAKIDLYDEYVEECKKNQPQNQSAAGEERIELNEHKIKHKNKQNSDCVNVKVNKMCRSHSANVERAAHLHDRDRRRKLRRSVTEKCHRKSTTESEVSSYAEDEMSSEEFRRTVEAFIERQQRSLREEEDFSVAVVSFEK